MTHIKLSTILIILATALLPSCSQNDEDAAGLSGEVRNVTVNVMLAGEMHARSATVSEENASISRYALEAYVVDAAGNETLESTLSSVGSDGAFNLALDRKKTYRFYCWADGGAGGSSYDISSGLSNVRLLSGSMPTVAHCGASSLVSGAETSPSVTIAMRHAVAKVELKTQAALQAGSVTMTVPTYAEYDAIGDRCAGSTYRITGPAGPETEIVLATESNAAEVLSAYVLVSGKEVFDIELNSTVNSASRTINNVPLAADCRTVLLGNVSSINDYEFNLTATPDLSWTDQPSLSM